MADGFKKNLERIAEGWQATWKEWTEHDIPETIAAIKDKKPLRALHEASGLLSTMIREAYRTWFYLIIVGFLVWVVAHWAPYQWPLEWRGFTPDASYEGTASPGTSAPRP